MTDKSRIEELLESLHTEVAKELLKRIKDGTAKPADLTCAVKFLKDNGIEATVAPGSPLDSLAKGLELPFPGENLVQ